ncbi:MAG: beta strand repeat-containing protein [Burkholderiaceae bacterium]
MFALSGLGYAQTCGIPGLDGPATPTGVVNSYHAGSGNANAGTSIVTVASAAGQRTNTRTLRAGDLVLIIQMQDGTTPANAGLHEYALVTSVATNVLSLNRTLSNSYVQDVAANLVRTFQVVYVPQYASADLTGTVTADRWTLNAANGQGTGGVVAIDVAGSLALTGTIDVNGAGFRGGAAVNGTGNRAGGLFTDDNFIFNTAAANGAVKGEGTAGTPIVVFNGTATPVNYAALLTQGYTNGSGGRAAIGNAGGGGNDGLPATGNNQFNSGGGGGSNGGDGGRGGFSWSQMNDAGGRGATAIGAAATRLVLGGGGGSGSTNNNGVANAVTVWPPTVNATTRPLPPGLGIANGAAGPISISGASGGGMVLIRAGTLTGNGTINANGYTAHNASGGSEGAGGGGAGGTVFVQAGDATSGALTINVNGGGGGYSNWFDHGPGGGGGGGSVITNFATATVNRAGGTSGYDGCCGGTQGNGSPKLYSAVAGSLGSLSTAGGTPTGLLGGASCLPVLQVTKSTLLSTVTAATGATTQYALNVRNTGGAATNLYLIDATLPPDWTYATVPATTYSYSPVPPGAGSAGAETTAATGGFGLPRNNYTTANSAAAISLQTDGAAPGVVSANGSNSPTFGSFFIPQGGSITVNYVVTIPDTATVGTYHNPAGVVFLDPTRTAATPLRAVSPADNVGANRQGVNYTNNTSYLSGSTTLVAGANYSGLQDGPTTEDVRLVADLSITKTAAASATPGTTFTYTLTPRNNGRAIGTQTYATTQASDVTLANVPAVLGSNPVSVTDTLPSGVTITGFGGSGWVCSGTSTAVCTLPNAAAFPVAAATNFPAITATATLTVACTPAPLAQTNTVQISAAAGETQSANNTATAVTTPTCVSSNLSVTKANGVASLAAGSTTSYTVTFVNSGPSAANGTVVSDATSAGVVCSTVTCVLNQGGASCPAGLPLGVGVAAASTTFFGTGTAVASLPANSTVAFSISCNITASGQ